MSTEQKHIVLVGDSIFDNEVYVKRGDAVIDLLKRNERDQNRSLLLAKDGAVLDDALDQLDLVSPSCTDLIISCGGNDVLRLVRMLSDPVTTVSEACSHFYKEMKAFEQRYERLVRKAKRTVDRVVICTVYDTVPGLNGSAVAALAMFNATILRVASSLAVPVIDLRTLFTSDDDYSETSPIEPSVNGGRKIVKAIQQIVEEHDFSVERAVLY